MWCQKMVYPRMPPPRPKPADSDSDTEDEDESELFWENEQIRYNSLGSPDPILKQLEDGQQKSVLAVDSYGKRKCRQCRMKFHELVEIAKKKGELVELDGGLAMLSEACQHQHTDTSSSSKRLQRKVSLLEGPGGIERYSHLGLAD